MSLGSALTQAPESRFALRPWCGLGFLKACSLKRPLRNTMSEACGVSGAALWPEFHCRAATLRPPMRGLDAVRPVNGREPQRRLIRSRRIRGAEGGERFHPRQRQSDARPAQKMPPRFSFAIVHHLPAPFGSLGVQTRAFHGRRRRRIAVLCAIQKLLAGYDLAHERRQARLTPGGCQAIDQRLIGKLNGAAQRVANQLS